MELLDFEFTSWLLLWLPSRGTYSEAGYWTGICGSKSTGTWGIGCYDAASALSLPFYALFPSTGSSTISGSNLLLSSPNKFSWTTCTDFFGADYGTSFYLVPCRAKRNALFVLDFVIPGLIISFVMLTFFAGISTSSSSSYDLYFGGIFSFLISSPSKLTVELKCSSYCGRMMGSLSCFNRAVSPNRERSKFR